MGRYGERDTLMKLLDDLERRIKILESGAGTNNAIPWRSVAPPTDPVTGRLWIDTSGASPILKIYDESTSSWSAV